METVQGMLTCTRYDCLVASLHCHTWLFGLQAAIVCIYYLKMAFCA